MEESLFTWANFTVGVTTIIQAIRDSDATITGVVGIPRGGLVLATALSHAFAVPLHVASSPEPWMPTTFLACDDNTITGGSLAPFASAGMPCAVLVKHPDAPGISPFFYAWEDDEMWLFPWEIYAPNALTYTTLELLGADA